MPSTYETEGGTTVVAPDEVPFAVDPITGVTINSRQNFYNPAVTRNNLARYEEAFALSQDYAARAVQSSLTSSQNWAAEMQKFWAEKMQPGIQQMTAADNAFNQQQRLQAVEYALPGARQTTLDAIERANTYAQGRLISSIDDRAFESVSRSMAADSTFLRGFGDDSVVGRKTSDILSAKDRLGLAMMGEGQLQSWLQTGNQLFVDQPIKSNVTGMVPYEPTLNAGAASLEGAQWLGGMNMLSQAQNIDAAMGQAQMDLQTQMYNSGIQMSGYEAELANAQMQANALQLAYNQEANMAQQQLALDQQAAGQKAGTTNAAISAGGSIAAAAVLAFL